MMHRLMIISLLLLSVDSTTVAPPSKCERAPAHAQPADAHYKLNIAGDPDLFLAGELYTVSLQGVDSGQGPTPFTGFTIWLEFEEEAVDNLIRDAKQIVPGNQTLGTFQAFDAQTKPREFCTPAVINATTHPKTEIQVIWNAPFGSAEVCVRVCARAGPVLGVNSWSVLARKICSTPVAPPNFTRQPPIVDPCCACDEAKYEVTFEGLWSRNMHPRDFPTESAQAHFGDLIGASHTAQYRVWQEGRVASVGVKKLADDGSTTSLERELKAESDHIRTIIKARGVWRHPVSSPGTSSTFAVFRVDAKHHLVSLAAKLAPSPDWFVGVSALELCHANCTWSRSATLPLYPYDAGTDNGLSYTSRRQPTIPAAPVRALRPDWPRDVRSPFFSSSGEMRPFARLRLTRQRLYEKSCDDSGTEHVRAHGGGEGSGSCATLSWGAWGPCSVTCGAGRAVRQRYYVWPARAYADACRVQLTDHKHCYGPRRHCRAVSEYEPDPAESSGPCAVSGWSGWSACEGCGVRTRTRHYLAPRAHKRCHVGFRARTIMSQTVPCEDGPCHRPPGIPSNSTNHDWFYVDKPRQGECVVTSWGEWSPCSARCGRGRKLRTRIYLSKDTRVQQELSRRLLYDWNKRFAELQGIEVPIGNITADDTEVQKLVEEHIDNCQFTLTQQESLCDGESTDCFNASVAKDVCSLSSSVGHCRGYKERWFYDSEGKTCEPFGYTGCGGNANNFPTREECMKFCSTLVEEAKSDVVTESSIVEKVTRKPHKPTILTHPENNEVMLNDTPFQAQKDVYCETGPWVGWSYCIGECDYAFKINYRHVLRHPSGSGKECPNLIKINNCRPNHCRNILLSDPSTTTTLAP